MELAVGRGYDEAPPDDVSTNRRAAWPQRVTSNEFAKHIDVDGAALGRLPGGIFVLPDDQTGPKIARFPVSERERR